MELLQPIRVNQPIVSVIHLFLVHISFTFDYSLIPIKILTSTVTFFKGFSKAKSFAA